jgi:hypothetical protein
MRAVLGCVLCLLLLGTTSTARAADDDLATVFVQAAKQLKEGNAGDAIASFEALADRGLVDPVASYDRGLAYAARVRIGAESPGDLGRAAHGFEEARDLSHDAKLVDDASRALSVVRSELARRRMRAGEPVEVDPGRSLARTVAGLLAEDTWAWVAVAASAAFAAGLFVRWSSRERRVRIAGGVTAGMAAPALVVAVAMTLASRHDRLSLHEAIVVTASARPVDDHGFSLPGAKTLPEAARVEIVEKRPGSTRVRFGNVDAWVSSGSVRELAR